MPASENDSKTFHKLIQQQRSIRTATVTEIRWNGQGRIQDLKLGRAHLKKWRRADRGAKFFGVFRVKNHDFTQKKRFFFQFKGVRATGAAPGSAPDDNIYSTPDDITNGFYQYF